MLSVLKIVSYPIILLFWVVNFYCVYTVGFEVYSNYIVYKWFGIGLGAYLILKPIFRKNLAFIETFTHELTHTIVGLMFFQRIHSFSATDGRGGEMEHSGKYTRNVFIALAPYCLPIFTFFLLIIRFMIAEHSIWIFDILIGFTAGFHFLAMIKDIGPHQTDIQKCGYFFSYMFIIAFLIFNACIIVWSITKGLDGAYVNWWNNMILCYVKAKEIVLGFMS